MNKFLLPLFLITITIQAISQSQVKIDITVSDAKSETIILAYRQGDKTYVKDSFKLDNYGKCTINKSEPYDHGLYLIAFPKREMAYSELLMGSDQEFSLKFEYATRSKMLFTGNEDNELFQGYLQYLESSNQQKELLQKKIDHYEKIGDLDSMSYAWVDMDVLNENVEKYQQTLMKDKPNAFLSKLLGFTLRPKVPGSITDKTQQFYYYKSHYFDHADMTFDPIIRTPIYLQFLNEYIDNLTTQRYDSIIVACDFILEKIPQTSELFKITLVELTNRYANSKKICFDAIYLHLVKKYYMTGKAYWLNEPENAKTLDRMTESVKYSESCACGTNYGGLTLYDKSNKAKQLSDFPSKYTLLVFWTPGRDEEKLFMKQIASLSADFEKKGFEVIGISTSTKIKTLAPNMKTYFCASQAEYEELCKRFCGSASLNFGVILDAEKRVNIKYVDNSNVVHYITKFDW